MSKKDKSKAAKDENGQKEVKLGGASGKIFELEPGPQRSSSAHEKRSPTDVVQEGDDLSRAEGAASAQRRNSAFGDMLVPPDMSTEQE